MFLRVAGRVTLNAASLNTRRGTDASAIAMTRVPVVVSTRAGHRTVEVPAVSGSMVRHCHFAGFLEEFRRSPEHGRNLTRGAWERDAALRFARHQSTVESAQRDAAGAFRPVTLTDSEDAIIEALADADLYGFVVTPPPGFGRTSILGFSFWLPVEELVEEVLVASVIHPRAGEGPRAAETAWAREYSSAVYGFAAFVDAPYIGRSHARREGQPVVAQGERRARARAAVLSFVQLLSGRAGAGLSRGLPVSRLDSLAVAVSERPIPFLVNGHYRDYIDESRACLAAYARLTGAAIRLHLYRGAAAPDEPHAMEPEPPEPPTTEWLRVTSHAHWVDLLETVTEQVVSSAEFADRSSA